MNKLRIALVGLGRFAIHHVRVWLNHPEVEVVALCDARKENLNGYHSLFPEAACFTSLSELLADVKLDAVDVMTPEHTHAEVVKACLLAGKHVFVEKPLTTDSRSASELIQLARRQQCLLMVGHVLRFDPRYAEVKTQVETGRLGPLRSIYARRNNGKQFFSIYNRVSPIFILGIHDLDIMHWLSGSTVKEVYARRYPETPPGLQHEPLLWSMLSFDCGMIGVLENHWMLPESAPSFADTQMEIVGEQALIQLRNPDSLLQIYASDQLESPAVSDGYVLHGVPGGPLVHELHHFVTCVRAGRPSTLLRPEDAYAAVVVAEAIVKSAQSGRKVSIDEIG